MALLVAQTPIEQKSKLIKSRMRLILVTLLGRLVSFPFSYQKRHAKPFSMFVEISDDELFVEGVKISRELDRMFGQVTYLLLPRSEPKQQQKITAVSKDVPGFPRSAIPLLASQGVEALHIGVNAAITPPGRSLQFFREFIKCSRTSALSLEISKCRYFNNVIWWRNGKWIWWKRYS